MAISIFLQTILLRKKDEKNIKTNYWLKRTLKTQPTKRTQIDKKQDSEIYKNTPKQDRTHQREPERHQRYEAIKLIRPVHRQTQYDSKEIQSKNHSEISDYTRVPSFPNIVEMSVSSQKKVRRHKGSY